MLISEKTTGSIYLFIYLFIYFFFFFASKEAYPVVRQLEKITVKKAQGKVVKCAKNKSWVPRNPPLGHLSVNHDKDRPLPQNFLYVHLIDDKSTREDYQLNTTLMLKSL